jgi:pyruvate dehydrogenase E2 component (dihydrolipoamide acetyltransferase)
MEEGTILKWLKQVGDPVAAGEVIAEVETDKADMELEAAASGVLSKIQVAAGEQAAVGTVLALLDGSPAEAGARDAKEETPSAPQAKAAQASRFAAGRPVATDAPPASRRKRSIG